MQQLPEPVECCRRPIEQRCWRIRWNKDESERRSDAGRWARRKCDASQRWAFGQQWSSWQRRTDEQRRNRRGGTNEQRGRDRHWWSRRRWSASPPELQPVLEVQTSGRQRRGGDRLRRFGVGQRRPAAFL